MIVNKTNVSVQKTNFLDMTISIYRGKFYIKLYDKRNDYDFDVISFPYLDGNIPQGQSYGIFISQLIIYARISTSFSNFIWCPFIIVNFIIVKLHYCEKHVHW